MKKFKVPAMIWMIVLMAGGIAHAECSTVDDDLNLTIPCLKYENRGYELILEYSHDLYWKFLDIIEGVQVGDCARVDGDFNLLIPCVEYHDQQFGLSMEYVSIPDDPTGFYWQPGTSYPVARSTMRLEISPVIQPTDLSELVRGNSTFNCALYQILREESGNLFYSP